VAIGWQWLCRDSIVISFLADTLLQSLHLNATTPSKHAFMGSCRAAATIQEQQPQQTHPDCCKGALDAIKPDDQ